MELDKLLRLFKIDPYDFEAVGDLLEFLFDIGRAPLDYTCWRYAVKARFN